MAVPVNFLNLREEIVLDLEKEFSKSVRQHLGYFPVWQPGDAIVPGDIGDLDNGVFRRQASISEIFPKLELDIESLKVDGLTRFRSEDCTATTIQASGNVPAQGAVNANAAVELKFGKAGGSVFDALNCTEVYIKNLLEVRTHVEQHRDKWPPKFKLATRITKTDRFMVLISGASGASVDISGDAKALGSWNLAHASVSTSNQKNVGYERTGNGAILVGLYGFGWFGKSLKVLSFTAAMSPDPEFRELPARDPSFD
jgi:hypothetical protein